MENNTIPVFRHNYDAVLLNRMRGASVINVLFLIPVILTLLFVLVFAFYEGRKAYWDYLVQEMCQKDGGITVYEKVLLSRAEYRQLGGFNGSIPLHPRNGDQNGFPYYTENTETIIREWNPRVRRSEHTVRRASDGKTIARSIYYSRMGGDLPTGLFHDSSFGCPKQKTLLGKQIIEIREE